MYRQRQDAFECAYQRVVFYISVSLETLYRFFITRTHSPQNCTLSVCICSFEEKSGDFFKNLLTSFVFVPKIIYVPNKCSENKEFRRRK